MIRKMKISELLSKHLFDCTVNWGTKEQQAKPDFENRWCDCGILEAREEYSSIKTVDYKYLFEKYLCHIGVAEGIDYVCNTDISPAKMGDMEFSEEEKKILESVFSDAQLLYASSKMNE